ncbi:MAG: RluA family pseudouridine synthase [Deltaproteobacteria bacterium]
MEQNLKFKGTGEDAGERLDVFLAKKVRGRTRSAIKNLIQRGAVSVNNRAAKPGYTVRENDLVQILLPEDEANALPLAEAVPLDILYEDGDIIIVNKPASMAVHPGAGRSAGTLVNALLGHTKELSTHGGPLRPGIVHRLDKDTTGVMVIAKNDGAHANLAKQFKEHSIDRVYTAIVWGRFEKKSSTIDMPIGRDLTQRKKISGRTGKPRRAVTRYTVLKQFKDFALLELKPETGRTHQLRVHLCLINHHVAGDPVYGRKRLPSMLSTGIRGSLKKINRQCLHAGHLGFMHPTKGVFMEFKAPLPDDMNSLIKALDEDKGQYEKKISGA